MNVAHNGAIDTAERFDLLFFSLFFVLVFGDIFAKPFGGFGMLVGSVVLLLLMRVIYVWCLDDILHAILCNGALAIRTKRFSSLKDLFQTFSNNNTEPLSMEIDWWNTQAHPIIQIHKKWKDKSRKRNKSNPIRKMLLIHSFIQRASFPIHCSRNPGWLVFQNFRCRLNIFELALFYTILMRSIQGQVRIEYGSLRIIGLDGRTVEWAHNGMGRFNANTCLCFRYGYYRQI